MKNYTIVVPIAGYAKVIVNAETDEEAIEIAKEKAGNVNVELLSLTKNSIEEFNYDVFDHLTQGNVRYYDYNNIEIEYCENDED